MAVLLAGSGAGGCGYAKHYSPACVKLRRPPATLQVQWVAAEGVVRNTLRHRHNSIGITVRDPAGLALGIGSLWDVWCRLAPEPELDRWIANAEILRSELHALEAMPESHGELLIVSFRADAEREVHGVPVANPRYSEVADLSPAALEAARDLSCMASATFGAIAEDSIVELMPALAARVRFPAACSE